MVSLEKNRVFDINKIARLGEVVSQALETGHEARIKWIECLDQLDYIGSRVPAEIKLAALTESIENANSEVQRQGNEYLNYEDLAGIVRKTAIKLSSIIPACDNEAAGLLTVSAATIEVNLSILEELKSCIETAKTDISPAEYLDELYKFVSDNWETFTAIQDTIELSREVLKGMPNYTEYHGDPVNMSTGNFLYRYRDLSVQGKHPMEFIRFYNALDKNKGALGRGWIHNWETRILAGPERITLIHPDGMEEPFASGDGTRYRSCRDGQGEIQKTEDGFCLCTKDESILLFDESGKLTHRIDENETVITLTYEEDMLVRIQADTGEYFRLEYNDRNLLAGVSDHSGRSIQFAYNKKKLETVTDPLGQTTHFHYGPNGRIDRITDKRGICILQNEYDDNRRITRQEFPDGGVLTLRYLDRRNRVCFTEQNGNRIVYVHDGRFRNIKTGYEDGSELYDYDRQDRCTTYTDKRRNKTHYEYNELGCLTAVTDALSHKRTASYDEAGRILAETGPDGSRTCYAYDGLGRLVEITDPLGYSRRFSYQGKERQPEYIQFPDGGEMKLAYDHRGNISAIKYPDGRLANYRYDSLGRVIEYRDGNGNRTAFSHDGLDRITRVVRSDGRERIYEYSPMGEATRVVDFDGFAACWDYNVLNKPERYTDKEGRVTRTEYDRVWQPVKVTDPEGGETCYAYDRLKRLTEVTDPTGRTVRFAYDPNGNLLQVRYPDGSAVHYEYDALNRRTAETNADGGVTRFVYDPMGRIIKTIDPAGGETCCRYDPAGNKIREEDPAGAVTSYTYTSIGKTASVTLPSGRVERYHYLPGGRLARKEAGDGTWEAYDYDRAGNLLAIKRQDGTCTEYAYDCLGHVTQASLDGAMQKRYTYDALGNVTAVEDALGNRTLFRYSPEGNLTGVTDPEGNRAVYVYNGRNELAGILRLSAQDLEACTFLPPGGNTGIPDKELWEAMTRNAGEAPLHLMRFERDASGRPLAVTDALGQKESWQYDSMGRITARTDREGKTSTFTYTPGGKPGSASYPDGRSVLLSYDALGNLERVKDWLGELCFTRDGAGRITEAGNHRGETLRYEWNPDGTRRRLEYPDGLAAKYCYDSVGRLSALTCGDFQLRFQYDGNGRLAECLRGNGVSTRYVYNRAGLPSLLTHARGTEILEQLSCRYDPLGNPVRVERKSAEAGCSCACEYAYDQNGRLSAVRMDGDPVREYRYDGYGNRTSAAPGAPALPPCPYTPLDQPPGSSYTPNGGLIHAADGCEYRYDALGHLTEIIRGGELLQGNEYDGLGHRVHTFGQLSGAFGGDIRYTIDDTGEFPHILMEQGGRERKYLWQENTLCGMPEEGRYVLTDPLGTPLVVAGPDGQVQNAYRYDEFGLSEYRREEAPLPFGFTGCLADRVEGLYYANAREYHAGSGRFLTKDLSHYMDFKDPGTLNLYQYAKGNPLKYVDPSGHESINEETSYLDRTLNMVVYGSFTNEFTWAGLGIQLLLGLTGVDAIFDARDLIADATVNRDLTSPSWWVTMALDAAAVIPLVGVFKYADDLVYGVKTLFKNGDEVVDGSRRIIKAADSLGDLSKTGRTAWNHLADSLREMAKNVKKADMLDNARYVDNAVDAVSDTGKRLDDVVGGGLGHDIGYMKNNSDPMRDVLGSGRNSNPEEWESIIQDLEKNGVEIRYREGDMAYAPGLTDGSPGQLVIDPDASLSALKHEYQHFLDAQAEGFPSFGKQMFDDPKTRVIKELRAYMVEIKEADRLGLKEVSEQLFENYRQEREWIVNQYIMVGGE